MQGASTSMIDASGLWWIVITLVGNLGNYILLHPTPSLFVTQRPSTYSHSQGYMGKFGETKGGVGKSGCLSTKSLKRGEEDEKVLWRACGNSPALFRAVPFTTPYGTPSPRLEVRNSMQNSRFFVCACVWLCLLYCVHRVSKKTVQTYFLSQLCQISTDCGNFWHKDSKENKLF